jgi:hypothetical protein
VLVDVFFLWRAFVESFGWSDFGVASLSLSPELELELEPVDDFPQSHEADFELLSSSSSLSSQPELPDELLELLELELLEELDDDELLELLELELLELELEELDVESLPQLSPALSLLVVESVPVDDVLPQLSSATGASSPVSSYTTVVELPVQPLLVR